MNKKVIIIVLLIVSIFLLAGITYSSLNINADARTNENIAKFIFDFNTSEQINLPLYDLKPGDTKIYDFSVTNSRDDKISDVSIEYQIILKTYHFMPLDISLYRKDGNEETLVMNCDESYSRNEYNELVCKSELQEMDYSKNNLDNYIIKLTFNDNYNSYEYSNLIDYIDLEIESYQKVSK